jgi:hypothetical protein
MIMRSIPLGKKKLYFKNIVVSLAVKRQNNFMEGHTCEESIP